MSRGWVVAVRNRTPRSRLHLFAGGRAAYVPAFNGAVFASKQLAQGAADKCRSEHPELTVRVVREGIVK